MRSRPTRFCPKSSSARAASRPGDRRRAQLLACTGSAARRARPASPGRARRPRRPTSRCRRSRASTTRRRPGGRRTARPRTDRSCRIGPVPARPARPGGDDLPRAVGELDLELGEQREAVAVDVAVAAVEPEPPRYQPSPRNAPTALAPGPNEVGDVVGRVPRAGAGSSVQPGASSSSPTRTPLRYGSTSPCAVTYSARRRRAGLRRSNSWRSSGGRPQVGVLDRAGRGRPPWPPSRTGASRPASTAVLADQRRLARRRRPATRTRRVTRSRERSGANGPRRRGLRRRGDPARGAVRVPSDRDAQLVSRSAPAGGRRSSRQETRGRCARRCRGRARGARRWARRPRSSSWRPARPA